jgi:menaquinone-dependent protoporphyrinogen oxidase
MPRILIIYATREGQTGKVAREIAGHLRQAGADVQLLDAREAIPAAQVDVGFFDLLVFGASMHAGGLERELVGFVNARAADIRTKRRSFFLVLLSAATRDPGLRSQSLADARAKMNAQLQVPFEETEMIAGALKYSRYPLPLRWLMKRIAAKAGGDTDTSRDYEYTDWAQVEAYARRLADACEMNCYKTVHR